MDELDSLSSLILGIVSSVTNHCVFDSFTVQFSILPFNVNTVSGHVSAAKTFPV